MLESRNFEDVTRRFPAPRETTSAQSPLAEAAPRVLRGEANGCPVPALSPEEAR